MTFDEFTFHWVHALTGLDEARVQAAVDQVRSWDVHHLSDGLLTNPSVDNAVAVTLLSEAVEVLHSCGVPKTKLLAKLRNDRAIWPTWAELRSAALLVRVGVAQDFELEPNSGRGKNCDFVFRAQGVGPVEVEFKAIGLSDDEVSFCGRFAPSLDRLLPPLGLLTLHAELMTPGMRIDPDTIPGMWASARHTASQTETFPKGLSGVSMVGHGGEDNYARRLWLRLVNEVASQIPSESGWGAFYWTNGAPVELIHNTIRNGELPTNLEGVILIGDSVRLFHPNIHSFIAVLPRDVELREPIIFRSAEDDGLAQALFESFQRSSGVRAVLLAATDGANRRELLRRDGSQRIYPFNLLIDEDPAEAPKGTGRSIKTS